MIIVLSISSDHFGFKRKIGCISSCANAAYLLLIIINKVYYFLAGVGISPSSLIVRPSVR